MLKGRIKQSGIGMFDLMVSITLIGIASVGLLGSVSVSMNAFKYSEYNLIAHNLASSKLEHLASINSSSLDSSLSGTETGLSSSGTNMTFSRTTTVTVSADGSKKVVVSVTGSDSRYPHTITKESTYSVWE